MKFSFHCICGGSMAGSASKQDVSRLRHLWYIVHTGLGHRDCDAKTARSVRRLDEKRADTEAEAAK